MKSSLRAKRPARDSRSFPVGQAVVEATGCLERGEDDRALALLEQVVEHEPKVPVFRYLLGVAQVRRQLNEQAIANFELAVRGEEQNVDFLVALSGALMAERPQDATEHLTRAVHLGTKQPQAYSQLAGLLIDARRPGEALRICDEGLSACGADPTILAARGRSLWSLARNEEALECLRRVETALPHDSAAMLSIGGVLLELGRVPEARGYMRRACDLDPESAVAHYSLGVVLLLGGDYREGFREYEFRWGVRELVGKRKAFPKPRWDGSALEGRRVLLHAEQGAGDTIQFVRYAEFVKERGGNVILLAPAPLGRLLSWLPGCELAALDEPLPGFDFHCPLVSLPLLAETEKDNIPPPARFVVPSEMALKWSGIYGEKTGLRVGLCWAGAPDHRNDRNRSFACSLFAPLLDMPGLDWFSLQVGPAAAQLAEPGLQGRIQNLAPLLTDYAETAAAISQLDLVITADTSVAHLAGSFGKPVWVLTPFAPDWRWLLERSDSPWYPGMRLFRQPLAGDWRSVMCAVGQALREMSGLALPDAPANGAVPVPAPAGQTDLARRCNTANPDPAWTGRARLAADFIPAGASVLDLGCGRMALEQYLPAGCRYTPCDVVRRDERTLVCNFNEQPVPRPSGVTHIAALGVLEYIHDWRSFLGQLRAFGVPVVLSYCPTDFTSHLDRRALGWVNDLSLAQLCAGFTEAGFHLQSSMRPDGNQILLRIARADNRLPVRRRVLVMSRANCGDFGDRLEYHTINSTMPAGAEIHRGYFEPWQVPPGDFDLLVLGTGTSLFGAMLTDRLTDLLRRIPRSVGIFGTQYRDGIDSARMSQLIDSLTVWFANSEEDVLLYGKGRQNVVHLGDWLIGAFPMTRWTTDETLSAGAALWNNLPLDRAIQDIQKYRGVISERLHPLLCALTSAERVAYREQRDDGSGSESGKFRSLLIDIFGRTWPEATLFDFPREAVAAYRARVLRVMSGMPQLFSELLEVGRGAVRS